MPQKFTKMKSIQVFLNYDLSFNGDYEGLFKWLDDHNADDCGQNFCEFSYTVNPGEISQKEPQKAANQVALMIDKDITSTVKLNKGDRIYIVSSYDNVMFSGFLAGGHGPKPWAGYSTRSQQTPKIKIVNEVDS